MVFLCSPGIASKSIPTFRIATSLSGGFLDPLLVQGGSVVVLMWLIYQFLTLRNICGIWRGVLTVAVPLLILFGEFFASQQFLEPLFRYKMPAGAMPEPIFNRAVADYIGLSGRTSFAAPAGYCLRQLFIMNLALLLIEQPEMEKRFGGSVRVGVHAFFVLCVIGISVLRVYRGIHTPFDIGLSFGVGTILFWFFGVVICSVVGDRKNAHYLGDMPNPLLAFGAVIYFYSQDTTPWIIALIGMIALLGSVYLALGVQTMQDS